MQMVVVGAGVSGLAAARSLRREHGVERVVVLEARYASDPPEVAQPHSCFCHHHLPQGCPSIHS